MARAIAALFSLFVVVFAYVFDIFIGLYIDAVNVYVNILESMCVRSIWIWTTPGPNMKWGCIQVSRSLWPL